MIPAVKSAMNTRIGGYAKWEMVSNQGPFMAKPRHSQTVRSLWVHLVSLVLLMHNLSPKDMISFLRPSPFYCHSSASIVTAHSPNILNSSKLRQDKAWSRTIRTTATGIVTSYTAYVGMAWVWLSTILRILRKVMRSWQTFTASLVVVQSHSHRQFYGQLQAVT